MRNNLVPKVEPDACEACAEARAALSGHFYANCDGCIARALAGSPAAAAGLSDPSQIGALKDLVRAEFPRDRFAWAATAVREWFLVMQAQRSA